MLVRQMQLRTDRSAYSAAALLCVVSDRNIAMVSVQTNESLLMLPFI